MPMKIRQFIILLISIVSMLVGAGAWIGAEGTGRNFESTMVKLKEADSLKWIGLLDDASKPLAEANVNALMKTTAAVGKALWVIKVLGVLLTMNSICLLILIVQQMRKAKELN